MTAPTDYRDTMAEKLAKAQSLSDAIVKARRAYTKDPTPKTGLAVTNLVQQRGNLLNTMRPRPVT